MQVEQLDYLANEHGLIRYDVRGDNRHAIVSVNIENDPVHPEFSFEAMQSIDESFSGEELLVVIKAIREYNNRPSLPFNRLPFTN